MFVYRVIKKRKEKIFFHKVAIEKVHLEQITFNCIQFYASTAPRQINETVANFSLISLYNKSHPCKQICIHVSE